MLNAIWCATGIKPQYLLILKVMSRRVASLTRNSLCNPGSKSNIDHLRVQDAYRCLLSAGEQESEIRIPSTPVCRRRRLLSAFSEDVSPLKWK
jgi:hypothetical protein